MRIVLRRRERRTPLSKQGYGRPSLGHPPQSDRLAAGFGALYRMSEVYSDWFFFKIPLSPFVKGGTGNDLERFNTTLATGKDAGVHAFPPLKKGGPGGILDWCIFHPTGTYL